MLFQAGGSSMAVFQNIKRLGPDTEFLRGISAAQIPDIDILSQFDKTEYALFPGFCDVHVHFREPGFSYKGTIFDGSRSAARGGYTAVCAMPNLNPVPDSVPHLEEELEIIKKDACIHVYPYAAITVGDRITQQGILMIVMQPIVMSAIVQAKSIGMIAPTKMIATQTI